MIKLTLYTACLLLATSSTANADPIRQDALNWIQTMAFAAHQTDYSGTFLYQYDGHVEISRITHIADHEGEHSRLESLDGSKREIIRHNGQVWCDLGDGRIKVEQRQGGREFPALLPEQISLLNKNYLIKPAEEVRLAGFHAHAIVFQPKDSSRYTHKMWADSVSGLLLKSEVLDEHGKIIEQYYFTQLNIGGNIDHTWMATNQTSNLTAAIPHAQDAHYTPASHMENSANDPDFHAASNHPKMPVTNVDSGWLVDTLPGGFKKIAEVRRQLHSKDAPVTQLVFSDGLASISVFIEQSDHDRDDHEGLSGLGIIQIYSKLIDDKLVTVVGEVPPGTVMQIADSVRNGASQ